MDELIYSYTAKVRRQLLDARRVDLLAALQALDIFDPAILEDRQPFFWGAEISNDGLDAHYTHMMPGTLRNFAADSRRGVAFLNSHRHEELPLGRSLDGRVTDNGERISVLADFYTLPGLTLNEISTDNFIAGVRSGIISDVSVGFYGGLWTCDICGGNYLSDSSCPHIAGMRYETVEGDTVRNVLATVAIDNANLAEVSAVFDGATPDATIIKARDMAANGELKLEAARALEARYRTRFEVKRSFAGADAPERTETMDFEKLVNDIRAALSVAPEADLVGVVTGLTAEVEQLRSAGEQVAALQAQVAELAPRAADGQQYRADLMADALAEGVRALGDKFDAEIYGNMLETAPLATIKRMRDDWRSQGDERFQPGRKSVNQGEDAPVNGKQPVAEPAGLYRA